MRKLLAIMMVILSALFVSLDTAEAAPGSYIFVENWFDANYSHKNSVEKVLMEKAYSLYGKTMKNGRNGCTEASVLLGSSVSPLLEEARQAGIVYNPYLKDFAKSHGYEVIAYDANRLESGDIIFFGDDQHAMIYVGHGVMAGNMTNMYGPIGVGRGGIGMMYVSEYTALEPTLIIKTRSVPESEKRAEFFRSILMESKSFDSAPSYNLNDIPMAIAAVVLGAMAAAACGVICSATANADTAHVSVADVAVETVAEEHTHDDAVSVADVAEVPAHAVASSTLNSGNSYPLLPCIESAVSVLLVVLAIARGSPPVVKILQRGTMLPPPLHFLGSSRLILDTRNWCKTTV